MNKNTSNNMQKFVSAFILWCMVASGIVGVFTAATVSGSVPESVPMIIPSVINGYEEIADAGVYDAEFNITINAGGTLRIVNTTLNFPQDDFTDYYIHVNAGGALLLENSTITTGASPVAMWDPLFDITLNDAVFEMTDNSVLAYPGTFTAVNTRTYINDSWITSLAPDILLTDYANGFLTFTPIIDDWWQGTAHDLTDALNDAPIMYFEDCDEVIIADSRIDEMYEDEDIIPPIMTVSLIPDSLGVSNGTGAITDIETTNDVWYEVGYLDMINVDGFDTTIFNDVDYIVTDVSLYVEYNNPGFTYSPGYTTPPFNGINYSISGLVPETFIEQIEENQVTDIAEEWSLLPMISTFSDVSQLNVNYSNRDNDGDGFDSVYFDAILINVSYQQIHIPAATNIITLDNTDATIINSYVGVDWQSVPDAYISKNAFELTNGANLFMYNTTIDDDDGGTGGVDDSLEIPEGADPADYVPFRIEAGSQAYYFKWLETSVVDRYSMPVQGARLNSTFHFTEQSVVNQVSRINNFATDSDPVWANAKDVMIDYLNRMYGVTAASFNITGTDGKAMIPLLTTYLNSTNYPNGDHVGDYDVEVIYAGSAGGLTACDFIPVPSIAAEENTVTAQIQLADVELPRPIGSLGLIVNGTRSVTMDGGVSDSLSVNDFIIVEDDGTLTISNANMLMSYSGAAPFYIIVRDNGQLILNNVDLKTQNNLLLDIILEGDAILTMTDSSATVSIDILASGNAEVNFNRTEIFGNFDTSAGANVMLNAWNTVFGKSLDDFYGTSEAILVGCSSPLSPNFRIEPSDSAKVWIYRWAEVTVYNGLVPATTLSDADIWISSQYPEFGSLLNRAGTTNSTGVYLTAALSDYIHYDTATSEIAESHYNLYSLVTRYQLGTGTVHNETTGLGLAAYPLMSVTDATTRKTVVLENVLPDLDPPLTVWPIGADSDVGRGNEVWINTTVNNTGDAVATGVTVRFNDIFGTVNTTIYTAFNASMDPGTSWDISFPYTWDSVGEIGWHTVTVYVDPLFLIEEQNEGNNFNETLVNVTSQSDLAMVQYSDVWSSDSYPEINEAFTLYAHVWNLGDLDATGVEVAFYSNGALLGTDTVDVAASQTIPATASIPVTYTANGTYAITVVIDGSNLIPEVIETNNDNSLWPMTLRIWNHAGLIISEVQVVEGTLAEASLGQGTVIVETNNRTDVVLRAVVGNNGELFASSVYVRFYNGDPIPANLLGSAAVISTLSSGSTRIAACSWEAMTDGTLQQNYTITAVATANGGTLTSNDMSQVLTVNDNRADIGIVDIELANNITDITGNTDFSLNVTVANNGYLDAEDFVIEVYASVDSWTATQDNWFSGNENYTERIGNITVALLAGGSEITREVECTGVPTGDYEIFVVIDSDLNNTDAIAYDGFTPIYGSVEEYDETNNNRTVSGTAVMPALMARIQLPEPGIIDGKWTNVYIDGETSSVEIRGNIVRVDKPTVGVPGVEVTVSVDGGESYTVTTGQAGAFTVAIPITATGNYTVTVSGDGIASDTTWFRVDTASVFPFWILILIVVIVVVIIVGITLYLYFVGLGKTVQCGECGAFIPEGAAKCPKCGVEFETEVAKCSVCGAWVPIDVKNCPECGTEFTVGTEDLDDYEAKMKRQYDDVVRKFREQAKTEIGKEFTETEFQAWWASKPTFITFDQWLKEEEEMKRMGSRPCPVCQMENSVTAKICHKCGSVMGDAKAPAPKKPEGKMPPAEKKPAAAPAPAPQKQQPPAQQPQATPQQHAAAPQPAPAQAAVPQTQQPAGTPGKKGCPSCGMEVNAGEKICPICNYDFGDQSGAQATRIVRKPIKKIVRRPGEPGGDQQQQQ